MLKFIALSGTTDVTENLYVYETENDMVVVDCGVGFPDSDMLGVDLIIPDFSYIKENKNKLRGILISHGHEDHLGALPFLLKDVRVPIYATKLVAGFIKDKLADYDIKNAEVRVFDPEKDTVSLGVFRIVPFRVSHSVPDGVGFAIDTPEGRFFHVSDYKFDWTPVDGRPFDVAKLASLASGGALALASDCLGATSPGYTESEREIEEKIKEIVEDQKGKVFFTTISSNISRIRQAINVAQRLGRKVAIIGRSIDKKVTIARDLGYIDYPNDLVITPKQIAKYSDDKIMYIISGCYGQPGSALYRLALGEHEFIQAEAGDVVVFSADPAPPGSKTNVDFVVDKLIETDCDVHYYDLQEDLHVSGHGSIKDIEMLFALVKPKYFLPIGGTVRHMKAYGNLAQSMGAGPGAVFALDAGEAVQFARGVAQKAGRIKVKNVLVDGLGIGDVGNVVLRDRHILAKEGVAIVLLNFDRGEKKLTNDPEIISRGFVFEGKDKGYLADAGRKLKQFMETKKQVDLHSIKDTTTDFLERYFYKTTGRRPMILPVVVEV